MIRLSVFVLILAATGALMIYVSGMSFMKINEAPLTLVATVGATGSAFAFRYEWQREAILLPVAAFGTTVFGGMVGGFVQVAITLLILEPHTVLDQSIWFLLAPLIGGAIPFLLAATAPIAFAIWLFGMSLAAFVIRYRNPDLNP